MEVNENTKIKYTLESENCGISYIEFTIAQMEGSVPNFYEQLQEVLGEPFKIIKREIIN